MRIVDRYAEADTEKKVELILSNYAGFTVMIDGFENSLFYLIKIDRKKMKRRDIGELGVRVQVSGVSDPTFKAAEGELTFEKEREKMTFEQLISGTDGQEDYQREHEILEDMRDDYDLVKDQLHALKPDERMSLEPFLEGEVSFFDLSEKNNLSYDAAKSKIKRAKRLLRENVMVYFDRKYT